jgi:hypothetical protein
MQGVGMQGAPVKGLLTVFGLDMTLLAGAPRSGSVLSPSFVFYYSSELITNHPEPGVLPYPVQPEGLTDHPERMLYH